MNRWIVVSVVIASSLAGCKKPESKCPDAKKAVKDAFEFALDGARLELDGRKSAEEQLRLEVPKLENGRDDLEIRIKLFEQSMDCLAKKDCCKHLAAFDLQDRTQVQSTAQEVLAGSLPGELDTVVQTFAALIEKSSFLGHTKPDANEATAWCTSARDAVAKLRTEAPAAWKQTLDALNNDIAEAHARVVAQDNQVKLLGEWVGAVSRSKSAPMPAGLDGDSRNLREVREAVATYQKCQ